jgi:hypothetical protein
MTLYKTVKLSRYTEYLDEFLYFCIFLIIVTVMYELSNTSS